MMLVETLPNSVLDKIITAFGNASQPAYGQVATVSAQGHPQVRTVHLHYLENMKSMAFGAHTRSSKWIELEGNKAFSGSYYSAYQLVQIRFQGEASLCPESSANDAVRKVLWSRMREEVRLAYWMDQEGVSFETQDLSTLKFPLENPTRTFGVVLCEPELWNVYELSPQHYVRGRCMVFKKAQGGWEIRRVSLLGNK